MTQEVLLAKFVWVVGYSSTEGFFDTANHDILLKKLEHVIKVITNSWFQSYLNDRMKFTTVNKCQSSKKYLMYRVPQGSVLGPFYLFYLSVIFIYLLNLAQFIILLMTLILFLLTSK